LPDPHHVFASLGWLITTRVALEQFYAKATFKGIDVSDDGRMVHPQNIRSPAYGAQAGNLISRSNFIPVFHLGPQKSAFFVCAKSNNTGAFCAIAFEFAMHKSVVKSI
jgi:hypothetical protein